MQVSTTKESLAAPLGLVFGAADTRGTVPMLGTVLIKTVNGKLSMLCSDLGMVARAQTSCEVKSEGEIAVDARRLYDLIRAVPERQPLDLSLDDKGKLIVKSGRSRFQLPTLPAAEYPRLTPKKEDRVSVTIEAKRLLEMIEQTAPAMADSDIRAYLNGMLVSLSGGRLWLVATDGHRMNVACEPVPSSEGIAKTETILPRKSANLARKLLAQGGKVKLVIGPADLQIAFEDGTLLFAKGIEGQFPPWDRVIPAAAQTATVDVDRLGAGLAMIEAMIEDGGKKDAGGRGVEITFGKGVITAQKGEAARTEIEAACEAEPVTIGLNISYLRDAVSAIGGGTEGLTFGFSTSLNSISVRPQGAEYPLAVVMPMRL